MGEQKLPTVLIVEDSYYEQDDIARALRGKADVLQAYDIGTARQMFMDNRDAINIIVMDACVPGNRPTTPPLVREIRAAGFTGPMIASSSMGDFCQILMRAGCDVDSGGKAQVPEIVTGLLDNYSATAQRKDGITKPAATLQGGPGG
jgi:hypothetical protein